MSDDFESWLSGREGDCGAGEGELPSGVIVGGYRIVALLGRGGFADVYRAEGQAEGPVAIKMLHRLDDKSRARFFRESKILSQVNHRNFPRLLGQGSFGDRPYLVIEFLRGFELPRGDRSCAKFLREMINATSTLHELGYVHRDIKPGNILSRNDGTPVLIDFGLAAPISAGEREREGLSVEEGRNVAVGTIGYSAPEQFSGLAVGREADVHSIGMLIGACFPGKMPKCWRRIYLASTTSNPKARYRTTGELMKAIDMRHWRGIVYAALILIGIFALVLLCKEVIMWYNDRHVTVYRFVEREI